MPKTHHEPVTSDSAGGLNNVAIFLNLLHYETVMKKTLIFVSIFAVVIFSFTGCTVTQGITLNQTRGGSTDINLETTEFFKNMLVDLTSFDDVIANSDKDPDTIILDNSIGELWHNVQNSTASTSSTFYRTADKRYVGDIEFNDLSQLISDLGSEATPAQVASLIKITSNSLEINISMENYDVLAMLVPFLTEENFEAYGPVYNHGTSEPDYLEMMDFILGDEASGSIMESVINLSFTLGGQVVSTNGTKLAANRVRFSIPLIKLLLLNTPIKLTCTWQ